MAPVYIVCVLGHDNKERPSFLFQLDFSNISFVFS